MGSVHRATDLESGAQLAIKRLRTDDDRLGRSALSLFEREYLTLSQLAHPRVVQVFDYGLDEQGLPFYVMELLDGSDLQALAPLHWAKVCAIAADICSALALVHSRRLVYRDLSPRNVRCTTDGLAKLIDFGAMTAMGPAHELVGTAPCLAPEALNAQPLDARTDLYALGATLYFALAQRHAYPARDLAQLRDVWRSRPRRPSEIVPDIPQALDQLVMDLLQFDASLRPASAAEVMQRLAAIGGARAPEQPIVAQSYLSRPMLVGRNPQLSLVRRATFQVLQRKGGALLIGGPAGAGRSRMLDACVLEAKLAGLAVVRLDPRAADERTDFRIAHAIGRQLLDAARPLAESTAEEHRAVLARLVPELHAQPDASVAAGPQQEKLEQQCMQSWLLAFARGRPLLIAVDDITLLDPRSAGFVAVLAQHCAASGILLAVTAASGEAPNVVRPALQLLGAKSTAVTLECLSCEEVEELLASLFGDVPNLAALAGYLHGVTRGNPRDTMQIAQHLVTQGVIQYAGGAWSLPDRLRLKELPASLRDALEQRARKLSPLARGLSIPFALEPTLHFSLDECALFAEQLAPPTLFRALEDLVLEDVLARFGTRYGLRQHAWIEPLLRTAPPAQVARAHAALAQALQGGERADELRAADHLISSGAGQQGLALLLRHVEVTTRATESGLDAFFQILKTLPRDWLGLFERALDLCVELNRPAREAALLLSRLEALISHAISDTCAYHHIQGRLDQLATQCGLDLYAASSDAEEVAPRMQRAFAAAGARFEALDEHARVYPPIVAVRQLAQSVLSAIGVIAFTHDVEAIRKLPPLAPLTALFPALKVIEELVAGVAARITSRNQRAIMLYDALLKGPFAATSDDLSQAYQRATRLRLLLSIATLEASMGLRGSLDRVTEVAAEPLFAAQVLLAQQLYYAWQGDLIEAERCKRQAEVAQVESSSHHGFGGQHVFSELCAYALLDDLTRVKRALDAIRAGAETHPTWRPMLHYARGEYERIRGDLAAARGELELALSLGGAGEQPAWANLAGAHVRVLVELAQYDEAARRAEAYVHAAERAELGYARAYILMPWSRALAHLGRYEEAVRLADAAVQTFVELGSAGLNLALAHETRARVALLANEPDDFAAAKQLAITAWPGAESRLLKLENRSADHAVGDDERAIVSQLTSQIETCDSTEQRAQCGIEYLMLESGATGALLYGAKNRGLALLAVGGSASRSDDLDAWAAAYFDQQLDQNDATETGDLDEEADLTAQPAHGMMRPVLLMHHTSRGLCITGLALLAVPQDGTFRHPARVAGELSRTLAARGDAVPA